MGNLFDYNGKFFSTMSKVADSIILGLLWLVCSIPVITIGASSSAFYYAYTKCVQQDRGSVLGAFFHGFKTCFKHATVSWLALIVLAAVEIFDFFLLLAQGGASSIALILLAIVVLFMIGIVLMALCLFPYIARYENTWIESVKNCILILFSNFFWVALLLPILLVAVLTAISIPFMILFAPSAYMFFANKILEHVFRKYMRKEDLEAQQLYDL